jgi:hypothetical protein
VCVGSAAPPSLKIIIWRGAFQAPAAMSGNEPERWEIFPFSFAASINYFQYGTYRAGQPLIILPGGNGAHAFLCDFPPLFRTLFNVCRRMVRPHFGGALLIHLIAVLSVDTVAIKNV